MIVLRRGIVFPSGVEGLMVLIFYIIRRVLFIPITLFGISLIVFSMIGMLSPYQRLATFISSPDRLKSENVDQLILCTASMIRYLFSTEDGLNLLQGT